jgi:hypothetical protein
MKKNTMKTDEIKIIKEIGEQIGYGHMMAIASALWRKSLKDKGYPESGAFVPVILQCIKSDIKTELEIECKHYDNYITL